MTRDAADKIERLTKNSLFSSWLRTRSTDNTDLGTIISGDVERILSAIPIYSVPEKQLLLLRHLENKTLYPSQVVRFNEAIDYPINWSSNPEELRFHIENLTQQRFIQASPTGLQMLTAGWEYLESNRQSRATGHQAFVAMSFSLQLFPTWQDAIVPGITNSGYRPFRTDASPDLDRIDVRIMTEIRRSRIMLADVTEQRPGVYFEAGFALGLNIPVFWSVREDDLKNVHFDTRQYNHIVWRDKKELKEELEYRIVALMGKGDYVPTSAA